MSSILWLLLREFCQGECISMWISHWTSIVLNAIFNEKNLDCEFRLLQDIVSSINHKIKYFSNKKCDLQHFDAYELDDFLGQGSSSLKKQPAVSISKKPPSTASSTAVKPSTSGAGAKRSFVKASWSIQNELLEHDEKDPTTMVANLKRIKAEAESERYTTLSTFWADLIFCIQ